LIIHPYQPTQDPSACASLFSARKRKAGGGDKTSDAAPPSLTLAQYIARNPTFKRIEREKKGGEGGEKKRERKGRKKVSKIGGPSHTVLPTLLPKSTERTCHIPKKKIRKLRPEGKKGEEEGSRPRRNAPIRLWECHLGPEFWGGGKTTKKGGEKEQKKEEISDRSSLIPQQKILSHVSNSHSF